MENVILFKHNIKSCAQLKELCASIQNLVREETGHSAFICIDQEGGCVTRLPDDAVNVPGEMALAATGNPEYAREAAGITARELLALGVNFNFAPVADINSNPSNPIIGARCFGDNPEQVTEYTLAALAGYQENHLLVSAKHFPGHGDTNQDSHISLPVVEKTEREISQMELKPFQALINAGCPAIMTAHILFPSLEPEHIPATMSRKIITGLLIEKMGFRGLVVSDCMEMDAVRKYYGTARGAEEAMKAGVDLILVSHSTDLLDEAALRMEAALQNGEASLVELDASVEKILYYKKEYCREPSGRAGTVEAKKRADYMRGKSITQISRKLPELGNRPLFVSCPKFQAGQVSNVELESESFAGYMSDKLGGKAIITGINPSEDEIKIVTGETFQYSSVVLGTYNAHLYRGQMAMIQALCRTAIPLTVVALRNPYDLQNIPDCVGQLIAWDYSDMTLEALVPVLAGEQKPEGVLPVRIR